MRFFNAIILLWFAGAGTTTLSQTSKLDTSIIWQEGYLDIHHINTGRGNATFFLFPDGTTLLFDAGELDVESFQKNAPLKVTNIHPNDSLTPGAWIVHYIRQVFPKNRPVRLDYAVISHFHADHYGAVTAHSPPSTKGNYLLTGITAVGEAIPIKKLLDRAGPAYGHPLNLKNYYKDEPSFLNYLAFVKEQVRRHQLAVETLRAGRSDQIQLVHRPAAFSNFTVRNVKSNGSIWTGQGLAVREYILRDSIVNSQGKFNENPLSLALKISYGPFDYFTGGDNTGLQGYGISGWFDVETPMARAVGPVEALTLNHHGNRDASNAFFLQTLRPRVVVQQVWCSDQPGQEVLHRLISPAVFPGPRDLFATNMHAETKVTLGFWLTNNFQSMQGHVLLRVLAGGERFLVYVLDDTSPQLRVKARYGPYPSY